MEDRGSGEKSHWVLSSALLEADCEALGVHAPPDTKMVSRRSFSSHPPQDPTFTSAFLLSPLAMSLWKMMYSKQRKGPFLQAGGCLLASTLPLLNSQEVRLPLT